MPACSCFWLVEEVPTEYREWAEVNHTMYDSVADEMVSRGVMPEPDSDGQPKVKIGFDSGESQS
jgi:hypothetical protein